ncbi:hypothetical protein [Dyella caseinilytica]|uniref:Uncharacterized protein n=1 Tax=Dyella caseinilytica TaxID=1849581 RepID=A0ABX7GQ43_9GAMM|nr:hypothetical protein [Dyella caseinilytica]QRN52424.1 hypothetical protein ISN74_13155 [Dyella caseinilytica]GGA05857.1 hypothetical protein GCM10011408_28510 [Dyella caseinilytica]
MSTAIYPAELFALRRAVRMQSHHGCTTMHIAERIALDALKRLHSRAAALTQATRYLRDTVRLAPKDCA